jgi:hypothetical protein
MVSNAQTRTLRRCETSGGRGDCVAVRPQSAEGFKMLQLNQVTAAASTVAERRQSRSWSVLLGLAGVCLGLAACGGGGGADGSASLGVVEVTSGTPSVPVAGAAVQGPLRVAHGCAGRSAGAPIRPTVVHGDGIARDIRRQVRYRNQYHRSVNEVAVTLDRTTSSPALADFAQRCPSGRQRHRQRDDVRD